MHTYIHTYTAIDSEDVDIEPICILSWEKAGVLPLSLPLDSAAGDGLLSI